MKLFEKNNIKEPLLPDHYDTIDELPMIKWNKIHKESDPIHLLKQARSVSLNELQKDELQKIWEELYNEFINVFGLSESLKDIMELELKIARLQMKRITSDDAAVLNFINSLQKQLNALREKNQAESGSDIYTTKNNLEKHFKVNISMSTCTVREFYSYLRDLKKDIKPGLCF